jgi:hypothetical protein
MSWIDNPLILINKDKYLEFYPNKSMSQIEKANSICRFGLYYGILIYIFGLNQKWLSLSFILILLSIFIIKTEGFTNNESICTKPTLNNPYMNYLVSDLMENPNKPKACELSPEIRDEQIKLFRTDLKTGQLKLDKLDLYGRNSTDRNFYTMPNTSIVNDQNGFANFLLSGVSQCKSKNKDCLKYRDIRFNRGRIY